MRAVFPCQEYPYIGTLKDTRDKLNKATSNQVPQLVKIVTQFAGQMALRLVHDHLLRLDLTQYDKVIRRYVGQINGRVKDIKGVSVRLFFGFHQTFATVDLAVCSCRCYMNI